MTIWDPVSKQPQLKTAAVKVESVDEVGPLLAHLRELEPTGQPGYGRRLSATAPTRTFLDEAHEFALAADNGRRGLGPTLRPLRGGPSGRPRSDGSDDPSKTSARLHLRAEEARGHLDDGRAGRKALRDQGLLDLATACQSEPEAHAKWFDTRIKTGAPQALVAG